MCANSILVSVDQTGHLFFFLVQFSPTDTFVFGLCSLRVSRGLMSCLPSSTLLSN